MFYWLIRHLVNAVSNTKFSSVNLNVNRWNVTCYDLVDGISNTEQNTKC
jgi:hypothetical protein